MKNNNRIFIDVREPDEYAIGHIEDSINIPLRLLETGVANTGHIAKDSYIIVYCRSGVRAGKAQKILQEMGYTQTINGISADMIKLSYNKTINKTA